MAYDYDGRISKQDLKVSSHW